MLGYPKQETHWSHVAPFNLYFLLSNVGSMSPISVYYVSYDCICMIFATFMLRSINILLLLHVCVQNSSKCTCSYFARFLYSYIESMLYSQVILRCTESPRRHFEYSFLYGRVKNYLIISHRHARTPMINIKHDRAN